MSELRFNFLRLAICTMSMTLRCGRIGSKDVVESELQSKYEKLYRSNMSPSLSA